uniref:Uncharacterized protein n=1 Tax=Acrobeloides nanus TaxID=290746 RepID=A0A914EQX7_9BILA
MACKEDGSISDLAIITNAFSSTWLTIKANATFGQDSFWWANAEGIYNDNKTFPGYSYWNDSDHTPMTYTQFSQ